jgi:hypothetical protein
MDENGNGIRDVGEVGVNGVTINLYTAAGVLVATTVSDANGFYAFLALQPGTYYLGFLIPEGYQFSPPGTEPTDSEDSDVDPATGLTTLIDVQPGVNDPTWNAGIYRRPTALDSEAEPDAPNRIFLPLIQQTRESVASSGSNEAPAATLDAEPVEQIFVPLVRRTSLGTKKPRVILLRPPPRLRIKPQPPPAVSCQQQLCLRE